MTVRVRVAIGLPLCIGLLQPVPAAAGPAEPADVARQDLAGDAVMAVVNGEQITVRQFREEMALRGGEIPGQYATPEQRRALLDEMIQERALVGVARQRGFDTHTDVVAVLERAMVSKLLQEDLDHQLESVVVSDDDVAAHYAAHSDRYARPERSRAAIVFIEMPMMGSDERRAELEQKAQRALEEARALDPDVRHFGPVARRYSDDRASRYNGGVIGWLVQHPGRRYKWDDAVVDALFSLSEPGEIAPVVRTESGFYLVRLVAREQSTSRPLEQVSGGIRQQLLRVRREQLREAFLASVLSEVESEIDEMTLQAVEPPTAAPDAEQPLVPPRLPQD